MYEVNIRHHFKGRCQRHPRYNPERGSYAGIRGNCLVCLELLNVFEKAAAAARAVRDLGRAEDRLAELQKDPRFTRRRPRRAVKGPVDAPTGRMEAQAGG